MDNIIIEHLACLEINNCILQEPFHMISNVQWNDKGLSFDGNITLYQSNQIKKENFVGIVPIQIKGTTRYKKTSKQNKFRHPIDKKDLEVYYKNGAGVIYFVVTVNPENYVRQAYFKLLAPLDLKQLLEQLDSSGNDSVTVSFKKLKYRQLEPLCKMFLNIVDKQPKYYIDVSSNKNYKEYKINYTYLQTDENFNLFEEHGYVYGVTTENIDIPVGTAIMQHVHTEKRDIVELENEKLEIQYFVMVTKSEIILEIEKSLRFEFNKNTQKGKLNLGEARSLNSFLKCLKLIRYLCRFNRLPLASGYAVKFNEPERFANIDEEIEQYKEVMEVAKDLGISLDYVFDETEDLSLLFRSIIDIFKNKKYHLLNIEDKRKLINVKLSDSITVAVIYQEYQNKFINFFSNEALNYIAGFAPKGEKTVEFDNETWKENYWRLSIYGAQSIEDLASKINFNFDILKKSFNSEYHDIESPQTINMILDFITYYDENQDTRYLELASDLIQRYLEVFPKNEIALINLYQIKIRQKGKLNDDEKHEILDILEKSYGEDDLSFACEILLEDRLKAKRLFDSMSSDLQKNLKKFPIYNLYKKMF
ncbi:hypothetical protein BTA31_13240 [Bacillus haynesii]|uniref:DUF4365 domain-containing protein n=1 Tax=Bacillus haynesii TaxID=1925021 RepID=A0ABX3I2J2_9BACI|nr:DUF4365 domain-containing protein [Bacillus haynesii]OMI26580.1 hypothetical protein BTA31_13240 [Bacillus haynesii]